MQIKNVHRREERKRVSISATVIFVALSCLLCYGAMRWMGGTVQRFMSDPGKTALPDASAAKLHAEPETEPNSKTEQVLTDAKPAASPIPISAEPTYEDAKTATGSTEQEAAPEQKRDDSGSIEEEPLQETGIWDDGSRYSAAFHEERMDIVIVLADDAGYAEAICLLALCDSDAALLAIPSNCIVQNGKTLQSYPAEEAVKKLEAVIPIAIPQYLVLQSSAVWDAIDRIGPLQIADQNMDGAETAAWYTAVAQAPLIRAERFLQILSALPEKLCSLSMLKLLLIKETLDDSVHTNIKEADGWNMYRAMKTLPADAIQAYTLPVESVFLASERVYRPDVGSTEKILSRMFDKTEKSSEKTS